jgi:glycosyltransferase involved in cell wall biosynthesis
MSRAVLLIGNYPPPYGGVPRYIENLAPFLAEQGWDVHVLSTGHSGQERHGRVTVYKLPWWRKVPLVLRHGGSFHGGPLNLRVRTGRDAVTRAWLHLLASVGREIVRRHDVRVICGFNLSRGGIVGAAIGRERRLPFVVNNFGELLSNERFFRKNPHVLPFIAASATRLVSGSRHCASTYQRFGLSPAVQVIPYGVDAARFRPDTDGQGVRRRVGAAADDVVVLFLGRLNREMGLDTLLAAAPILLDRHRAIRLVLAGGAGELSGQAQRYAAGSDGRVAVLENVPYAELPALYAAADLVVAPTAGDRACSSLAAAEALATGRPVVASAVGGIPELVHDGETGALVPPGNPLALAESVLRLAADGECRRALGARGRRWIEAEWDTRIVLGRMAAVLDEAAGERR